MEMLQQPTSVLQSFTKDIHSELPRKDPVFKQNKSCLRMSGHSVWNFSTIFFFFFPAGGLFTDLVQRSLLGMEGSLLCVDMKEGGNRTLQVFILKLYHTFGWLLVPKLIMLWKRYRSRTRKAWRESKGKEPGMTSRKGNSTDQRVFNVLHMLQPFKQHVMAPETL